MKKALKRILAYVLCAMLLQGSVQAKETWTGKEEYRFIQDLVSFIEENAKFPAERAVLLDKALEAKLVRPEEGFNGMVDAIMRSLDEHSSYLSAQDYAALREETLEGAFCGIGVTISMARGSCVVISALPDSPAQRAGILPGDILIAIDGENVENEAFEIIRSKIRGEQNTVVEIGVRRGKETLSFSVVRTLLKSETVEYKKMGSIGYMQITSFSANTSQEVEEGLSYFRWEGVQNLILDLRDNPGGEMQAALDVCRQFVPKGVIMRVEYANSDEDTLYYNEKSPAEKWNLVVLVNEGSASAAELLAGAIQDTKSGHLIGRTTFGKGTVQTILPIVTGGAIRLTVAEYKTARGRAVHHKGIEPDTVVKNSKSVTDTSYMVPMAYETAWKEGDSGEGVLAIEQRLAFWKYIEEADRELDKKTAEALCIYQAQNGLPVTGTADLYTQISLTSADYEQPMERDDQMAAALEYFNEKD